MIGSEKQIAWAEKIINFKKAEVEQIIREKTRTAENMYMKSGNAKRRDSQIAEIEELKNIKDKISLISDNAKWYIDNQYYNIQQLVKDIKNNEVQGL